MLYESQYYGIQEYGSPNEYVKHYGVLGMKWGQRKYQNPDGTLTAAGKKHYAETGEYGYHYKSHSTKKYTKKAAKVQRKIDTEKDAKKRSKLEAKKKEYEKRRDRSAELDRREQAYANKVSAKGNIAARSLTTVGSKAYQQYVSMLGEHNNGRKLSSGKIAAAYAAKLGRPVSSLVKGAYLRSDKVYNAMNKYGEKARAQDEIVYRKAEELKKKRRK